MASLKEPKFLKLSLLEKLSHYGLVWLCLIISVFPIGLYFLELLLKGHEINFEGLSLPKASYIFLGVAILLFFALKMKLKFQILEHKLADEDLRKIIEKTTYDLKWDVVRNRRRLFIGLYRKNGVLRRECLTILYKKNRILWAGVHDPFTFNAFGSLFNGGKMSKKFISRLSNSIR